MADRKIKRALISVYDKTGIVDFARALCEEFGIEIISTGGTAALLKKNGIPVTLVEEVTGFPEMMDGRVKTLHPKIHAGILADRDNPEHMRQLAEQGIKPIDMVVVNLYPFEKTVADPNCTFEEAIEMIDIGGPCLLRAAAKNHRHVVTVPSVEGYSSVLGLLRKRPIRPITWSRHRIEVAFGAFNDVRCYDADIEVWLQKQMYEGNQYFGFLQYLDWGPIRYGENPHQTARLLQVHRDDHSLDLTTADQVGGDDAQPEFSFNNYVDGDSAVRLCEELSRELGRPYVYAASSSGGEVTVDDTTSSGRTPVEDENTASSGSTSNVSKEERTRQSHAVVFVKHTNACGVGIAADADAAYRQAYLGDPNAAMGGILACSFPVSMAFVETVMSTYATWGKATGAGGFFLEVWAAPEFEEDTIRVIRSSKKWGERLRLLETGYTSRHEEKKVEYKTIAGGLLVQDRDLTGLDEDQWKVVTKRKPTESELSDLRLAWLVCKHTKSNAITICKDGMLIGNGAGQMSRVMSCRIATWLAKENGHEEKLRGSVAASDAFFPFSDGPGLLIDAGVSAIIQPGGSKRDADTIAVCDERDAAMIFTGTRHFKH